MVQGAYNRVGGGNEGAAQLHSSTWPGSAMLAVAPIGVRGEMRTTVAEPICCVAVPLAAHLASRLALLELSFSGTVSQLSQKDTLAANPLKQPVDRAFACL